MPICKKFILVLFGFATVTASAISAFHGEVKLWSHLKRATAGVVQVAPNDPFHGVTQPQGSASGAIQALLALQQQQHLQKQVQQQLQLQQNQQLQLLQFQQLAQLRQ